MDKKVRTQRVLGLILLGCGVGTSLILWSNPGLHMYDPQFIVLFLGPLYLAGIGLILFAPTVGSSPAWSMIALVPIIGPFVSVVTVALSYAWKRIRKNPIEQRVFPVKKLVAPMLGFTAAWGILAALSISGFMNYEAQMRTHIARNLARSGLQTLFGRAMTIKKAGNTFVISDITKLGEAPMGGSIDYSFWYPVNGVATAVPLSPGSHHLEGRCDVTTPPTSVTVAASATGFIAAAKGNIDNDATCDEWSINDAKVLTNTLNDVTH